MKVSLCIPTYNAADTIERTIESLINQTMNSEEYEIIVIDDCSSDNTISIIEETAKKHDFKNISIHKLPENSGHASRPRNKALDLASAEYIYFIDGDDFLYPEAIARMYKLGSTNNSDLIIGKYKGINRGVPKDMFRHNTEIIEADILEHRFMWAMSILKMFKRSEIERLNLRFDLEEPVGEDVLFFATFIANTKVWSIVGDYDCYGVVGHDGVHLSKRVRPIEDYLRTQRKTINAFKAGEGFSEEQKLQACGKYFTRIIKHGKYPSFYKYTYTRIDIAEKELWLKGLSKFTNEYIPYESIKYINNCDKNIFVGIRDENMLALSMADQLEMAKSDIVKMKKENKTTKEKLEKENEELKNEMKKENEKLKNEMKKENEKLIKKIKEENAKPWWKRKK